jgi:hypothetical protein
MNNASSLTETIKKKQELAEKEEELTKEVIEDTINIALKNYFREFSNEKLLEALRDKRDLYICLKMPKFENRNTRIGKIYIETVNKILKQQNEANLKCLMEIETDKTVTHYIVRSKRDKGCVGNVMNTVIIHIIGKEAAEKPAKETY